MDLHGQFRRLLLGLQTLAGIRRGFFIPYRYAAGIPDQQPVYAEVEAVLAAAAPAFRALLAEIRTYEPAMREFRGPPPSPRFDQSWFPTLDAAIAYTLVRRERPRRIIEIGSGHSTRFLARAVLDGGIDCDITAVDPAPRASLDGLNVNIRQQIVQQVDRALFTGLHANDVLFIDSSHIMMPGSDVDWLFSRVLPSLKRGVLLHIHDILLPDDYPPAWRWRGYNEQQLVPGLLFGGWQPVFASHYVLTRLAADVAASPVAGFPAATEAFPTSLWLRRG